MARLPENFNATQIQPQGNTSQLPVSPTEGWPVVIVASEVKPVKDKPNCAFLEFTLQIIEGEHAGQTGPYRLNLFSDNEKAVEIAYKQLSAVAHVTGQLNAVDSSQFHNIPMRAVVGLQKKKNADDPDFTHVTGVKHIDGNEPGKAAAAQPAAAPQAPPAPPQPAAAPAQAAPAGAAPWQPAAPAAVPAAAPGAAPWNPAPAAGQPAAGAPSWAAPQGGAPGAAPWQR